MGALTEVSRSDFEAVLDQRAGARGLQILQAAFIAGTVVFGVTVAVLALAGPWGPRAPVEAEPPGAKLADELTIMSLVHAAQAVLCWGLAFFLYGAAFSPARLRAAGERPLGSFRILART